MYPETAEEIFTEAAERAKQEQNPQRPMEKGSKNCQPATSWFARNAGLGRRKFEAIEATPLAFEKRGPAVSRRESDQVQLQGHEAQKPFRC